MICKAGSDLADCSNSEYFGCVLPKGFEWSVNERKCFHATVLELFDFEDIWNVEDTVSHESEQLPRSSTASPSPFRVDGPALPVASAKLRSPVPQLAIWAGKAVSSGRLFIFTSRRRGRADRSGIDDIVSLGQ